MPSTLPWKRPGASDEPTSAITSIVIESAVTPVSVAFGASVVQSGPEDDDDADAAVEAPDPDDLLVFVSERLHELANTATAHASAARRNSFTRNPPGSVAGAGQSTGQSAIAPLLTRRQDNPIEVTRPIAT